ncbi:tetratricopeptide repeat protein [Jannaschia donghaensis]|uniref:Putative O-linked N-acetylglucosamine transferase, SPINDLY family n=1 Tax=Jannaschia donghaensis TaxID=420998 RepID=A0A0M6YE24_9RHOB|nr:hypothetical protein [Jannaschia donghaensis]CTQ48591.1 putative O-linked N-acetylglucosamine transferase, SPINDLY family [Jannaschia donghaensis]
MLRTFFALVLSAAPAFATCPPAPDIAGAIDGLIDAVQDAPDEGAARVLSGEMWTFWAKAPDARAQDLLDDGMARRASFDLAGAVTAFDALIEYCPEYAEGYNQRAFANFIREDFAAALPDLDRALALQPRHIPAMAGKGLTLIRMGRIRDGQAEIRRAVALNPWLSERIYLTLKPESTDL